MRWSGGSQSAVKKNIRSKEIVGNGGRADGDGEGVAAAFQAIEALDILIILVGFLLLLIPFRPVCLLLSPAEAPLVGRDDVLEGGVVLEYLLVVAAALVRAPRAYHPGHLQKDFIQLAGGTAGHILHVLL